MSKAAEVVIQGAALECKHCGNRTFTHRRGQLNTALMTALNLDWLNASADIYVCDACGFLHWFLDKPDTSYVADDRSSPSTCLACGTTIPVGSDRCPKCGWSYRTEEDGT